MLQNKKNARVFNGPHVEVALATDTFRVDCRQLIPWDYFRFARDSGKIATCQHLAPPGFR
jgi:hypothetical protein